MEVSLHGISPKLARSKTKRKIFQINSRQKLAKRKWILKLNNFLYLHCNIKVPARVAELVDALDSKSGFRKEVLVRFQSRVLYIILKTLETQCLRGFLLFRTFLFFTFLPYVLTSFVPLMSPDLFMYSL